MKKTKIICSIGPASSDYNTFKQLIEKGMNVARINFSHATIEEREQVENLVKKANEELNTNIAILYDTKGPDFRTGVMAENGVKLEDGKTIKIIKKDVLGTEESFTVNFKKALDTINVGDFILLEDGLMKLEVIERLGEDLNCRIIAGGLLKSKKGINVPGVELDMDFLSQDDINDIRYACEKDGDFLALSFVNNKDNIIAVRNILNEYNSSMKIIAKIESGMAIQNLDEIIEYSDGIMVARGDLGVEVPLQELPMLQKMMIKKCREQGKVCIVATEMLASMYTSSRPTRAEVTDIANAVLDGTDAVMLSGETTVGKYPIDAAKYMADICENTEKYLDYNHQICPVKSSDIVSVVASSVVTSANALDVKAIVAPTTSGITAKKISTLRPKSIILAPCTTKKAAISLALNFGVYTTLVPVLETTDEIIEYSKKEAIKYMNLQEKDKIIIAGGFPKNLSTNFMKIEEI